MKGRLVAKEALLAGRPRYNTITPNYKEGSTFTLYHLNFCGKVTLPVRYLVYNEHDVNVPKLTDGAKRQAFSNGRVNLRVNHLRADHTVSIA